jgi:hypothetical protein
VQRGKRGATGTVRGMDEQRVEKYLLGLTRHIREAGGGLFRRVDARDYLMLRGVSLSEAEGLVFALMRIEGLVRPEQDGFHKLTGDDSLVKHRLWKFRVGNLSLHQTKALVLLADNARKKHLTPELTETIDRARKALTALEQV